MKNKRKIILLAALIITGVLITYPVRTLVAGYYFQRAIFILRDAVSDKGQALPISGQTMPAYISALRSLENASVIAPSSSLFDGALSEVYVRMGRWSAAMELMHAPLPDGSMNSKEAYQRAEDHLRAAIWSSPSNPDYHFALGNLHDVVDRDSGQAEKELSRAIAAFPVNAPLRYAVALEHLKAGRRGDALEHAGVLARMKNDDLSPIASYFLAALEIGWMASGDPEVVMGLCPDEARTLPAVKKFFESKGIRE